MPQTVPTPVALVDDHNLVRSALAEMINSFEGYQVVVEAVNGEELVRAARTGPPFSIAIIDLHMPVMDGYATIQWLRTHAPATRALALTFEQSDEALVRAIRLGACGYLVKDVEKEAFKSALDQVVLMGHCHADDVRQHWRCEDAQANYERTREKRSQMLTERESEFLALVCREEEYTYDKIAHLMGVHRRTVDGFRESIFSKFNVKSKAGLVLFAFKWGLATP